MAGTYGDVKNRFNDLYHGPDVGADVADATLDYIKRGERRIAGEARWPMLVRQDALTVTSLVATLSSDQREAEIIAVAEDADGDGMLDNFYHDGKDYKVTTGFARATGFTKTLTFFESPGSTVYLKYKLEMPSLTATAAHYLMFSEDLVLAAAQLEYLEDEAQDAGEMEIINAKYAKLLRQELTKRMHENRDMGHRLNDERGVEIETEGYDLDGDDSQGNVLDATYNETDPG